MTREEIIEEIHNTERDLLTFKSAMDVFTRRKLELDSEPERQRMFMEWPAVQATLNVLIMGITRCEGLLEDYRKILEGMDAPDNVVRLEKKHE